LLLMPVITVVLSIALLGERPSAVIMLGGIIVLMGVAIIVIKRDHSAPEDTLEK